jgi:ribonuclease BN (tRNA processing enzyme)
VTTGGCRILLDCGPGIAAELSAHGEASGWGHLCAADAARVAIGAGVGQLVLTHLGSVDPQWAQARKSEASRLFTGPVHLARPGQRYLVRPE